VLDTRSLSEGSACSRSVDQAGSRVQSKVDSVFEAESSDGEDNR
jgi:hypothetical protein